MFCMSSDVPPDVVDAVQQGEGETLPGDPVQPQIELTVGLNKPPSCNVSGRLVIQVRPGDAALKQLLSSPAFAAGCSSLLQFPPAVSSCSSLLLLPPAVPSCSTEVLAAVL